MRITLTRLISITCITVFLIIFWLILHSIWRQSREFVRICKRSDEFQTNLHDLAFRVHSILAKFGLTHVLCYGALWGQIRSSRTLPWVIDIEMCILNEEVSVLEEAQFYRTFQKNNLQIQYKSAEGVYEITDGSIEEAKVELYVFELDVMTQMYKRIGWKRRVLPPDCKAMKSLECFPPRLILSPIPKKEFGGYIFPVPREGIELQKYHYEGNWWKEVKPKNC